MAKLEVHAGDFPKGSHSIGFNVITLNWQPGDGLVGKNIVLTGYLTSVSIATEEEVRRVGGTIGWGIAGAAILGPVGLLAGALLGGKGKDVTFVAQFNDGKKMLATTDSKTFTKMQALVF
ncbi:hypothetical protein [Massilia timonae]|uniref:Uncharacterized protein n=1 Tax=Massilia timonae TaxID=47229 RepID=A0A1S2NEW6_9BURK|nr:hypothetical protein [Massilia timonae]OIJ43565.1 hypothetical protein LO55_5012 [Massilia timonae]